MPGVARGGGGARTSMLKALGSRNTRLWLALVRQSSSAKNDGAGR